MSKWPIEFTIFKKLTDWNIQWNYSIKMSDWIIFKIFNKLTEWIHNKIFLGQLMFAWLAGWSEKYSKWFSDFEKTTFLFPDLIGEILLRNSTIWVENHCIGIYGPLKSLHRCLMWPKIWKSSPKNADVHMGLPWGMEESENCHNFPEAVGGGHPGVQLLCKVLDYSTRVKQGKQNP